MADAYTGTAAVGWDQSAWDRLAYFAFRPELHFDQIADVKPTNQTNPGTSVTFTQIGDLTPTATALSETVDVDAEAITDFQVSVTLAEYGKATITTAKLRGTSMLPVDPIQAEVIGTNAGQSLDLIASTVLRAGTNVRYAGGVTTRATVAGTSRLQATNVRRAFAELETFNTPKFGGLYLAVIHPDVKFDLREETGAAAWRDPHVYSQPAEIWNNEIGEFEGFRFIVTTNTPRFVDAGVGGTVDVYSTLFMGRQALAKVYSQQDGNGPVPRVVPGPITDKLRRFVPLGWYWLGGYGLFRQNSLRRVESASTIGANT